MARIIVKHLWSIILFQIVSSTKTKEQKISYKSGDGNNNYLQMGNDWYEAEGTRKESRTKSHLFPSNTMIELEPKLIVPIFQGDNIGIGGEFKISFPIKIRLDKLPLKQWSEVFDGEGEWMWINSRGKRSVDSQNATLPICTQLALQKRLVFKKLESFGNTLPWGAINGEACLLRTICEIQRFPVTDELGVVGDLLKELLSVERVAGSSCDGSEFFILQKYIQAEKRGKENACETYQSKCGISLFY